VFSVIITTYNRDRFLKRAYKSVLNQIEKPNEIIIINNGNYRYSHKDFIYKGSKKIKLKIVNNKKNLLQSKARNKGAKISKNEYLCFLDDDDTWDINYLKEAKYVIKKNKPQIILSKIYINNKIFKDPSNFKLGDILIKNPGVTGSNIIINKKTFFNLKGYDSKLEPSEDKSLLIDAIIKKKKIGISNTKMFFSGNTQSRLTKNYLRLSIGVKNFYKKYYRIMNFNQKIYVLNRICIYNVKLFRFYYFPFFIFFFMLNKILKINSKN